MEQQTQMLLHITGLLPLPPITLVYRLHQCAFQCLEALLFSLNSVMLCSFFPVNSCDLIEAPSVYQTYLLVRHEGYNVPSGYQFAL